MIPFLKKNKDGKKPPKPTVPRTAQESIPFQRMFEDGTCRVRPGYYTRTIQYQDINYQLAQQEDKTAIFEEWCSFLNFFDSSIHFELSFVNTATDSADFEKSIRIPYQQDGFDDVRAEYSQMLRQQLSKGNNGLTKTKFLTYGIEGDSMAQVKPRLEHIQNDLMNNFHRLGVLAKPLDGTERLRLMHGMLNMDGANKFHFNWKDLVPSGLSVKDAIAPTALAFKNSRTFQMGGIFGAVSFLNITASDLSDQLLKDFLDMDSSQIVTMHIQSVDQNKAIKTIKHTITELDRSKIEEQKKAIRAGYDMDVLPSDLATYGRDAKALLKELQSQNERMFLVTFLVLNTGKTEQELETNVFQAVSIAQKHNCELCRLDFQQEQGLMSSLPLADCQIEIQRGLTTSSTAIFVPFTTQELFDNGKESLYYGLNALSNNLIMVDRKKLKNPNGLILGTPGSGKSFSAKREICNAFLVTDDVTGRRQKSDVIAYQIRQSFKPGEITAEEANKVGYELAMRFTKGKYAFIVATHTDREHIHNHIIYNSTALDSIRKFRDFLLSGLAVQRLSDLICLEHQLSVIEIKPYRERQKRTLYPPKESNRDRLCGVIDTILAEKPKDYEDFLQGLEQQGYEVKRGKYTSVKGARQKRFIRFRTLGAGYSEEELKAVISGEAEHHPRQKQKRIVPEQKFQMLVDIQAKLAEGKSMGYARWAKRYNLKEMSKTLIFLQENKIGSIEEMQERIDAATARYHELGDSIKATETRMAEIAVLRTHIVNYARTRPVYDAYRKAGYSKRFLDTHREEITLHKAAKTAFDEAGLKKLPKAKDLSIEYAELLKKKKESYPDYRKARDEMQELMKAQKNVEMFFAEEKSTTEKGQAR